jgi:hypothetical protein
MLLHPSHFRVHPTRCILWFSNKISIQQFLKCQDRILIGCFLWHSLESAIPLWTFSLLFYRNKRKGNSRFTSTPICVRILSWKEIGPRNKRKGNSRFTSTPICVRILSWKEIGPHKIFKIFLWFYCPSHRPKPNKGNKHQMGACILKQSKTEKNMSIVHKKMM